MAGGGVLPVSESSVSLHLLISLCVSLCVSVSYYPTVSPKSVAPYFGLCFTVSGCPPPIRLSVSPQSLRSFAQALFLAGSGREDLGLTPGIRGGGSEEGKEETGERESEDRTALLSRNRSGGPGGLLRELGGGGEGQRQGHETGGLRDGGGRGGETPKEKGRD